ncbi:MAG: Abi family protein [Bacteroidaceae bacterium]|nr:Abi family protein [Bacteroidaceae bacterium]
MDYTKRPLTLQEQVKKLESRGLRIDDEQLAIRYLSNISYYRLRAYTYPFQNNTDALADHRFKADNIDFADIIDLYCFDRRLRSLMFNAIEKIEVAVRAKIVQVYSEATGNSHWFCDRSIYKHKEVLDRNGQQTTLYTLLMKDIEGEIGRSNEDFIKHYYNKYDNPPLPPAWMTLEVLSLGTLSKLYQLLKKSSLKKSIAKQFGLNDDRVFANWLHAIAVWRNCCAHHSRVWNRRCIINLQMPKNTDYPFLDEQTIKVLHPNKIFAVLCCIKYISNIISPDSDLKRNILSIIGDGGNLLNLQEMGFPKSWKFLDVWK